MGTAYECTQTESIQEWLTKVHKGSENNVTLSVHDWLSVWTLMFAFSSTHFLVRFVAKGYILQQRDKYKFACQEHASTNFSLYTDPNPTMHSIIDWQTDITMTIAMNSHCV